MKTIVTHPDFTCFKAVITAVAPDDSYHADEPNLLFVTGDFSTALFAFLHSADMQLTAGDFVADTALHGSWVYAKTEFSFYRVRVVPINEFTKFDEYTERETVVAKILNASRQRLINVLVYLAPLSTLLSDDVENVNYINPRLLALMPLFGITTLEAPDSNA